MCDRSKVLRSRHFFTLLSWKCASRHNGGHFFDISTSKSVPGMVCFVHFDLDMCFAPQPRALFRHLNFEKWSETVSFLHFWLRHVLRATTACNFSSLIWPDGSAPAALARLLFDLPEPQIIGKTPCFATLLPFRAPASSFLWLFLFCDLHFSSLLFSDPSPLCFSICPYCRKFGFWASFDYSIYLYLVISYLFPHIFVWSSCFWFCISLLLLLLLPLRCPPVTHHLSHIILSHPSLSHTTLSHIIFHTQLCHTHNLSCTTLSHTHNFVTRNFVTHHLSHTTLSHTQLCHTPLCHTPYFTQLCHTQLRLSHTTLSHTNFITHSSTQTFSHTPSFNTNFLTQCVAGVALGDIDVPFAWQAWRLATSTCVWRGKHGACGTGLALVARLVAISRPGRRGTLRGRRGACAHIHLRFEWQAWRLAKCTCIWRGRCGTCGTGLALVACLVAAWVTRARHHGTLRGGRGTRRHWRPICAEIVALGDIYLRLAWQVWHLCHWWRAWSPLVARGAAAVCVAGVVLGDIDGPFAWQAWRLCSHPPSFCVALGEMYLHLAWQVWHLWHWAGSGGVLGR